MGLDIKENIQVCAFLPQVLPPHHQPVPVNGTSDQQLLQQTVMRTLLHPSQTAQASRKETWRSFSATYLYRGCKTWNEHDSLFEFKKGVERSRCALRDGNSHPPLRFRAMPADPHITLPPCRGDVDKQQPQLMPRNPGRRLSSPGDSAT